MKVYFTASVSGKTKFEPAYVKIVDLLKSMGLEVFSDHILKNNPDRISLQSDKERVKYYQRMIEMISKSELVVAEISTSSLSVGHEITIALDKGKTVIALTKRGSLQTS